MDGQQVPAQFDTAAVRQADVQDGDVGSCAEIRVSASATVAASPTTVSSGSLLEKVGQTAPHDLVVVDQEHLDHTAVQPVSMPSR